MLIYYDTDTQYRNFPGKSPLSSHKMTFKHSVSFCFILKQSFWMKLSFCLRFKKKKIPPPPHPHLSFFLTSSEIWYYEISAVAVDTCQPGLVPFHFSHFIASSRCVLKLPEKIVVCWWETHCVAVRVRVLTVDKDLVPQKVAKTITIQVSRVQQYKRIVLYRHGNFLQKC